MKNKIRLLILLFSTGFSCFSQEAKQLVQSYTYRHYGVREGLVQSQIFYSFQDSYGYLWFCSAQGISRFDGENFKTFEVNELGGSYSPRYINQYEDAVFFVSLKNVTFIYPDQRIETYPLPGNFKSRSLMAEVFHNHLYLFNCHDPNAASYSDFSVFRFDLKNKKYVKINPVNPFLVTTYLSGDKIIAASCEREGEKVTVSVLQIKKDDLIPVKTFDLEKINNLAFYKTSQNELFVNTINSLNNHQELYFGKLINDSLVCTPIPSFPPDIGIMSIEKLGDNKWFVGVGSNKSSYILENGRLSPFPIPLLIVNHSLVDRSGNLWLSTEEGIYNCYRLLFETYTLGLKHNDYVWDIKKDVYDNIWFSCYGLGHWKADTKGILHKARLYQQGKRIEDPAGYMNGCQDEKGRLYLTGSKGLAIFDPRKGNSNRLDVQKTGSSLAAYYDTLTHSVFSGGEEDKKTVLYRLNEALEISTYPFGSHHIISICRDANQKLRIGTFHGDNYLDEKTNTIRPDTIRRDYKGTVSMALDNQGTLWKGTMSGLFAEDKQGNDTLISEHPVSFVLCYRNQYIIWGCNRDLRILDLQAFRQNRTIILKTFDGYSGFDVMECGQNGGYIDAEGYVWVVGSDKILRFLPEQLMKESAGNRHLPTACLAAIYNADKNTDWVLVEKQQALFFENESNYLRFDVLQASIIAPEKLVFRYRLKNYSDQWTTTQERSLVFQNIPHGKYQLEIQSSTDNTNWSESVFSPYITIKKPFFLTFPGLLIAFMGIASVIGIIIFFVRKFSIKKENEARQIDRLRHRAVQSKFIPHFTGNTLNSISYLVSKDPDLAQKYIGEFANFSGQTLLNSDKLCRTIEEEIDYTQSYLLLQKLRFEEKLEYTITIAPEVNVKNMIPTMVLHTFCENAIKHGLRHQSKTGRIKIEVYTQGNFNVFAVEDNGIGREKAQAMKTEGTQEGLKIVYQQLEIFNRANKEKAFLRIIDLYDNTHIAAGTRFELHIPQNYILKN